MRGKILGLKFVDNIELACHEPPLSLRLGRELGGTGIESLFNSLVSGDAALAIPDCGPGGEDRMNNGCSSFGIIPTL